MYPIINPPQNILPVIMNGILLSVSIANLLANGIKENEHENINKHKYIIYDKIIVFLRLILFTLILNQSFLLHV